MLNPVKNAKVIGWLLIIFGAYDLYNLLRSNNSIDLIVLFLLVTNILPILTGFWLIKRKVLGVYGLAAMVVLDIITLVLGFYSEGNVSISQVLILVVTTILFFWFWNAKNKFSK
jgi:membrane-bound ClpP family serine protease